MHCTCVLLCLLWPAQEKPTAYDTFAEPWRGRLLKEWEKEVDLAKAVVTEAQRGVDRTKEQASFANGRLEEATRRYKATRGEAAVRAAKRVVTQAERELAAAAEEHQASLQKLRMAETTLDKALKNNPPLIRFPLLKSPSTWQIGDYGHCLDTPRILQVAGKNKLLVTDRGLSILLQVPTTAGLVDGKLLSFDKRIVHVTGTASYKTVSGATRTVLTAEVLDLESLRKK